MTYEEDLVEAYFNLRNYFTIKNLSFSAVEKRPGGKGRGEIDILAILVNNGRVKHCAYVEVSAGSSSFPFISSNKHPNVSSIHKILKKFIGNDSHETIKKIIGNTKYDCMFISSDFNSNSGQKIEEELERHSVEFKIKKFKVKSHKEFISITVWSNKRKVDIIITPFSQIIETLIDYMENENLQKIHFLNPQLRGMQYLMRTIKEY